MARGASVSVPGFRARVARSDLLSAPTISFSLLTLVVAVLVLYPTVMLLCGSIWSGLPGAAGHFTLDNYLKAYREPAAAPK